jgi:hypothetical protein
MQIQQPIELCLLQLLREQLIFIQLPGSQTVTTRIRLQSIARKAK